MGWMRMCLGGLLLAGMGILAHAELQSVQVGGSIRIRGNWYDGNKREALDTAFVEQRTRLHVKADFTDSVTAFIELDSYDNWGEDFRSDYFTGLDARAASVDDVEIYQGYLEAKNMWGTGLELKVGRQELAFGSQWLLGVNDASSVFTGLSFDAVKLGYVMEDYFRVHAFWAKLAETFQDFGDGDVDLYGIYATLTMIENVELDAYWLFLREDGTSLVPGPVIGGYLFNGLQFKRADIHTIGLRGAGAFGGFDFDAEAAFQFGSAKYVLSGDEDYSTNFGANITLGYTFALPPVTLRPFLGFACFINTGKDFLGRPDLAFNRMFSNWEYSEFLENTELSNAYIYRAGLDLSPHDSIDLQLVGACFQPDRTPTKRRGAGAWELGLYGEYRYTEDLAFRAGFAKLWVRDSITMGAPIALNGLEAFDPLGSKHVYYVFLETELQF